MSNILNLANELVFKITKASNGFFVFTEEPSPSEEDTIVQKSIVFEETEVDGTFMGPEKELEEFKTLLKLIYSIRDFFGIMSNHYYLRFQLVDKETEKEVEIVQN